MNDSHNVIPIPKILSRCNSGLTFFKKAETYPIWLAKNKQPKTNNQKQQTTTTTKNKTKHKIQQIRTDINKLKQQTTIRINNTKHEQKIIQITNKNMNIIEI